ncbi:MAG: Mu-like prophage major head subunit gpT family protein [Phycisphaerales bacterium]|nr:Mu-like prophage major head subunit gpT family protein [Phycisphaerales bacterium]
MPVTTTATPLTLRNVRGEYFLALNQQLGASWSRMIASVFPTDQPQEQYPWLGASPNLRKWEGERTVRELRSDTITIVNDDYETGVEFRLPDLRRDKTGQMVARVRDMATRVAMFPERLLTDLLLANGNAYDGVAFFADTHAVGSSGTIDNNMGTGDGMAGGATPTTAQMSANILLAITRLMGFRDDQGEPLNEAARQFALMAPPNLWGPSVAAIQSDFTSASASNPLAELRSQGVQVVPMVNARLTATNTFYIFRTDAGIRPFLVQEEGVMPVELGPDSERAAMTNRAYFGHGWRGGVGYGRFELAVRAATS